MFPHVLGSAGVMKKNGKVKGIGVFNIDENLPVAGKRRVVRFYQGVQLVDTAQGMLIGSIAMKEFMLNKAFESSEFRAIATKNSASVHESEGACDLPLLFQNSPEGATVFLVVIEALVDSVPVGLDEFTQGRRRAQMMFLAMEEEVEESSWFFRKDVLVFGEESPLRGRESIKFLGSRFPAEGNPGGQSEGTENWSFNFCDLEDTGGVLMNIPGVEVVVPHEGFDAA